MRFYKAVLKNLQEYKILLVYPVLFLIYCYLCHNYPGHFWDTYCWQRWAIYDMKHGLHYAYRFWTDYLPLYHYVLYFFAKIQGSPEAIFYHIHQLRYFTLFVEFVAGFFLLKLAYDRYKNLNKAVLYSLFYFANIFMFYNTVVWSQIDGMLAGLIFISFFFAYQQKISLSLVFHVLAINLKLQAIIFLPLTGLMLLPVITDQFSWKNLSLWLFFPAIVQLMILAPFIVAGDMDKVCAVVIGSMGKFPVVSMNALNIWSLFLDGNLMEVSDQSLFLGISYNRWGLLLFFISSFFALFYLLKFNYKHIRNTKNKISLSMEKVLIIATLIPLLFFYFNTQMHERYMHPALIFAAAYTIFSKRPLVLIWLSIAYFINMEVVLGQFYIFNNARTLCPLLYLGIIISLLYELSGRRIIKERLLSHSSKETKESKNGKKKARKTCIEES